MADHARIGEELLQAFAHTDGAGAGSAAAVGSREGLVQVDVHHVETHVARTGHAQHRVEVGAVVIHQRSGLVHQAGDFGDIFLEQTQSVGVGHHHGGHCIVEQRTQIVDIHRAVGAAFHLYHLQTGHCGRCRIGAVGRVGHNHLAALRVAARLMVCADGHQARQLAVSAGKRVEGELAHPPDFAQRILEVPVHLKVALSSLTYSGMHRGEAGVRRHLLVDLGVVFHRARPQRVESGVHAEIVGRHVVVVAHYGKLVSLRQIGLFGAEQRGA